MENRFGQSSEPVYSVALHAGAAESWFGTAETQQQTEKFLAGLIAKAETQLLDGAAAVDVVTDVVAALEDYPSFNSGKGSVCNIDGLHELEAAVIDGCTSEYRAAGALRCTKNPVRLARAMLALQAPNFLVGEAGDALAAKEGLEMVDNKYFSTPGRRKYWEDNIARVNPIADDHGTVGAVALDIHGNLAAANSTGGLTFKSVGRIGDTAVIGSGLFADDLMAIACSGSGEAILKAAVAGRAASNCRRGRSLDDAVRTAVLKSAELFPRSSCGVVAVDYKGAISITCNSRIFAVASASSSTPVSAGIISTTFPILNQHICSEDHLLKFGVAKYPTMKNQMAIELKGGPSIAALDRDLFLDFFLKTWRFVHVLKELFAVKSCGFISDGSRRISIYLIPALHKAPPSKPALDLIDLDNGTTESYGDYNTMTYLKDGILSKVEVSSQGNDSRDVFSMEKTTFKTFIEGLWQVMNSIAKRHGNRSQPLRLEFDPLARENVTATILTMNARATVPLNFPSPAPFHDSYPGYMTMEFGRLAANLEELSSIASSISSRLQVYDDESQSPAPGDRSSELSAVLHSSFFNSAVNFFGCKQYRFVPEGYVSKSQSIPISLEHTLRTIKGCHGVYRMGSSPDDHYSHLNCIVRGNVDQGLKIMEECVAHVAESMWRDDQAIITSLAKDTSHISRFVENVCRGKRFPMAALDEDTAAAPEQANPSNGTQVIAIADEDEQTLRRRYVWLHDGNQTVEASSHQTGATCARLALGISVIATVSEFRGAPTLRSDMAGRLPIQAVYLDLIIEKFLLSLLPQS